MRAAVITRFGEPEVLKVQEWPSREPAEGEVRIRTKAIGLNFGDLMARVGLYPSIPEPPFVPGIELAGVVEKVGRGVRRPRKGDRVMAFSKLGAYAELVCVDARHTYPLPKKAPFEHGAALVVSSLTAYHALLTLANVRRGEKLLLHAAAGGVGTMAIQIAKLLGMEIFATAGSEEKLEVVRMLGVDHRINYRTEDFSEIIRMRTDNYGVDVVLDPVGGKIFRKGWKLLAPMGRYVLCGFASISGERTVSRLRAAGEMVSFPPIFPPTLSTRNVGLFGFNLFFLTHKLDYLHSAVKQIVSWYENGSLRPVIGARFPFDRIADAQALLQSRRSYGKIVIEV